jgi:light-regulated signal transduction histidine kinase (bacteriophytochrome)
VTNGQSLKRILRYALERAGLQAELARKNAELARSNAELEQFAFVASHDLQAPLSLVGMSLNMLQRYFQGNLDDKANRIIARALDGVRRMSAMIDGLLVYARVGSRAKPVAPVRADAALDVALSNLKVLIDDCQASVICGALPTVMADDVQLTQVFQNLISNALKFHGNEPPRLKISASRDGDMWVFAVRDNGIGIPADKTERVFVIFERLHTQQEYVGTGIGLATCKKIVERHGGRMWVESTVGVGSTFYFSLPAAPAR